MGHHADPEPSSQTNEERHPAAAEAVWLEQDFPVSYAIFTLARAHKALASSHLSHLGLFPNQEILLVQLGAADALSQKTLARTLRVDHSTVAKSVARLERAGLVRRRRSEADRRISLVELTEAGRAIQGEIMASWERLDAATTSRLSALERHQLFTLATKVADGLEAVTSEAADQT